MKMKQDSRGFKLITYLDSKDLDQMKRSVSQPTLFPEV
jgi:hypothetical protein